MGTYYAIASKVKILLSWRILIIDLIERSMELSIAGPNYCAHNNFARIAELWMLDHVTLLDIVKSGYRIALNAAK